MIDKNELYTCVLSLYLKLNMYGLTVIPPSRAKVTAVLVQFDADGSGQLSYDEFVRAINIITSGVFGRAVTRVLFTCLCPPAANAICYAVARGFEAVVPPGAVPAELSGLAAKLPPSLPSMAVTMVLMLTLPFAQKFIQSFTEGPEEGSKAADKRAYSREELLASYAKPKAQ